MSFMSFMTMLTLYSFVLNSPITEALLAKQIDDVHQLHTSKFPKAESMTYSEIEQYLVKSCNLRVIKENTSRIPRRGPLIIVYKEETMYDGELICSIVNRVRGDDKAKHVGNLAEPNSEVLNALDDGAAVVLSTSGLTEFIKCAVAKHAIVMPARVEFDYPLWEQLVEQINPRLSALLRKLLVYNFYNKSVVRIIFGDLIVTESIDSGFSRKRSAINDNMNQDSPKIETVEK